MKNLFLFLLLAHTLVDFYVAGGARRDSALRIALRFAAYALAVFAAAYAPGFLTVGVSGIIAAALGAAHLAIGLLTRAAGRKWKTPRAALAAFITSQALNAACLATAALCARPYLSAAPRIAALPDYAVWIKGVRLLEALLLGYAPAAILVKLVLDMLPAGGQGGTVQDTDTGGGRLIGILEREITILLVFWQQYAVIGFIMAAKSIARYKQLEEQPFAEKYLVGTLASVLTALCISLALIQL